MGDTKNSFYKETFYKIKKKKIFKVLRTVHCIDKRTEKGRKKDFYFFPKELTTRKL